MKRLIVMAAITPSACATPPEKIAAVQMSSAEYAGLSCAELGAVRARLAESLAVNVKHQKGYGYGRRARRHIAWRPHRLAGRRG